MQFPNAFLRNHKLLQSYAGYVVSVIMVKWQDKNTN